MSARMFLSRSFELELEGIETVNFQAEIHDDNGTITATAMFDVDMADATLEVRSVEPKQVWRTVIARGEEIELTESELHDAKKILARIKS